METTPFYVVGGLLVVMAVFTSLIGLRSKDFPRSPKLLAAGIGLFALVVVATATAAVINARDEQQHRRADLAAEQIAGEQSAEAEQTGTEGPSTASQGEQQAAQGQEQTQEAAGKETLKLTSPDDGSLQFEPPQLDAQAGQVTIDYTNPSPVPHDISLESDSGASLGQGQDVTGGDTSTVSADLQPGQYTYFCAVPGHREGGMEGTLTVK